MFLKNTCYQEKICGHAPFARGLSHHAPVKPGRNDPFSILPPPPQLIIVKTITLCNKITTALTLYETQIIWALVLPVFCHGESTLYIPEM